VTPESFLAGSPLGLETYHRVRSLLDAVDGVDTRTSKSQVAFRRRHGFAYLWLPGQYITNPAAEVVLSIVLGRHEESSRFKEVVHPSPRDWMHHLEIRDARDVEDAVADWLREAAERAG